MKKNKNYFIYILIYFSIILTCCKDSVFIENISESDNSNDIETTIENENSDNNNLAIVKFFTDVSTTNARTIFPDFSSYSKEELTQINITVDDSLQFYWQTFEDCDNSDGILLSTGRHTFTVNAWIRNIEFVQSDKEIFINPGTNYITFELEHNPRQWSFTMSDMKEDDSDPSYKEDICHSIGGSLREKGNVDITVYFPRMEGNVKAKIFGPSCEGLARDGNQSVSGYIRNRIPYDIVSEILICNDLNSPYYNMMYFHYLSSWNVCWTGLKIIVEDENNDKNEAAYFYEEIEIAIGCTSRKTIVIPKLINVHHATYYDGAVDKNGNPHIYFKETFLYGDSYNVIDADWYEDSGCTKKALVNKFENPYKSNQIKNDLSFYKNNWQNKEVVKVNFVTNCDKKMEPVYVPKGSFKYALNNHPDGKSKSSLETVDSNLFTYIFDLDEYMYGFEGWYYDQACTQDAHESISISNDITLYAKWGSPTPCIISFVTNCDETMYTRKISKSTRVYDDKYNGLYFIPYSGSHLSRDYDLISCPTKTGFTFDGWYFDSNFTQPVSSFTPTSDRLTLYAKWVAE